MIHWGGFLSSVGDGLGACHPLSKVMFALFWPLSTFWPMGFGVFLHLWRRNVLLNKMLNE